MPTTRAANTGAPASPPTTATQHPEPFYKCLTASGVGPYSDVAWPLDGSWLTATGELDPCTNGIHVCRRGEVVRWLYVRIFRVECGGEFVKCNNKVVFRRARVVEEYTTWNERTQRLFAADCAEAVLHSFETRQADADGPRKAIAAARAFARGEIDDVALDAARSAAYSAADSAARSAAYSAAHSAAYSAARSAAYSAAHSAQTRILFDYLEGRRS